MKSFILKIVLFFIVLAALDIVYGLACQFMNDHSKGGGVKSRYYVCKESSEVVLIFGSSRAKHHYVPDIIEDSWGMSCFNTGEDGNGIIYCYGVLKMITKRYSPKLIIYDVSRFDFCEDDNTKYLDLLKPYYYEPGIDSIFWAIEPKTRVMMLSNLYRFNTTCLRIVGNYLHPLEDSPKGYSPLKKTMDYEPEAVDSNAEMPSVDSTKLLFFERFIQLCKGNGIKLVCCVSPTYKACSDIKYYLPIRELCEEHGIPFFYLEQKPGISNDRALFQDRTHLNEKGARLYTKMVVEEVRNEIEIN